MAVEHEERLHHTWIHSERFIPQTFVQPVRRFMEFEAASGIIMLIAAVAAIVWANSAFHETYEAFLGTHLTLEVGSFHLDESIEHLINDGLMAIFFFVVGLEIKRELVLGELRDPKAAALPVMAAVGGMVAPALIYVAFTAGDPEALRGWAVPMATDIAFSLGVLSLMGRRVPAGAKLFLLALAIADDLGGILVIAIFFTDELNFGFLGAGLAGLALIWVATKVGIRNEIFFIPMALAIWFFFLESGVHATIAGVILGFLTPARPMYGVREFDSKARRILDTYPPVADTAEQREHADHEAILMSNISRESVAPLNRWEHQLTPWVSFLIVPVFALANAGVRFEGSIIDALLSPVALGVGLGLVVGKIFGISLFTWLAVHFNLGRLPAGATWRHMIGVASTAGIGFTVALFITALAFPNSPILTDDAKVGIFAGSIIAGIIGATILLTGKKSPTAVRSDSEEESVAIGA